MQYHVSIKPADGTEYSLILKLLAIGDDADLSIDEGVIAAAKPLGIEIYGSMITAVNKMLVIVITIFNIYTEKI